MNRLVLVTSEEHFDSASQASREADDQLLCTALEACGIAVQVAVWNDGTLRWEKVAREAKAVMIRSCWDYHHDRQGFLTWAATVASETHLLNPLDTVRWNTHKAYLRYLAQRGLPVIETVWLARGEHVTLAPLLRARGWTTAVIKPTVSTNAFATRLVELESAADLAEGQDHLTRLLMEREVMIQPFLPSVETYGERSFIFICGQFTHAMRKRAALGEDATGEIPIVPTTEEVLFAQHVYRAVGLENALFARVDLVRDDLDRLRIMELELVEPRLFLRFSPQALQRLGEALQRVVERK